MFTPFRISLAHTYPIKGLADPYEEKLLHICYDEGARMLYFSGQRSRLVCSYSLETMQVESLYRKPCFGIVKKPGSLYMSLFHILGEERFANYSEYSQYLTSGCPYDYLYVMHYPSEETVIRSHVTSMISAYYDVDTQVLYAMDYDHLIITDKASNTKIIRKKIFPRRTKYKAWEIHVNNTRGLLAVNHNFRAVALYDYRTLKLFKKIHASKAHAVRFSPDNKHLMIGYKGGRLKIVDLDTYECQDIRLIDRTQFPLSSICFDESGKTMFTNGPRELIYEWTLVQ